MTMTSQATVFVTRDGPLDVSVELNPRMPDRICAIDVHRARIVISELTTDDTRSGAALHDVLTRLRDQLTDVIGELEDLTPIDLVPAEQAGEVAS